MRVVAAVTAALILVVASISSSARQNTAAPAVTNAPATPLTSAQR